MASPEHVEIAQKADLSSIKPYVKSIVVVPTKFSWAMTEEIFGDILLIPPLEEFCKEVNDKTRAEMDPNAAYRHGMWLGREQFASLGMRGFVQEYMNGEMPVTDEEIRKGYERYMRQAQRTREMYEIGELERAWTRVLAELPNVHGLKVGIWDYRGSTPRNSSWRDAGCEINSHEHFYDKGHHHDVCQQVHAPVGEALFIAAIASVSASRTSITELEMEYVVDGRFAWADNGALNCLDLSHLQTLSFQPVAVEERYLGSDARDAIIARYSVATEAILRRCSTTLERLEFCPSVSECPMSWPPRTFPGCPDVPPLPALRSFKTGLTLRLSAFAHFLHQSPKLTHLQLDGCHGDEGEWRELWDAIRMHPSRMELELEQLPCVDWTELSVFHHTGGPSDGKLTGDPCNDIDWSMGNYLSGLRHWDRNCQYWFDNGDGEQTEDDEWGDGERESSDRSSDDGGDDDNRDEDDEGREGEDSEVD